MIRAIALCLLAAPAAALTCAPPDPVRTFTALNEAPEEYVVVLGRLDFDPKALPQPNGGAMDPNRTDPPRRVRATMTGKALGTEGFGMPWSGTVILEAECFGPWCPWQQPGRYMAFLKREGTQRTLMVNACGGNAFGDPSAVDVARVEDCLKGSCG